MGKISGLFRRILLTSFLGALSLFGDALFSRRVVFNTEIQRCRKNRGIAARERCDSRDRKGVLGSEKSHRPVPSPAEPAFTGNKAFGENLIFNGNLEAGSGSAPSGWSRPDGITSLWKTVQGGSGHCIVLNTAVTHEAKNGHLGQPGTGNKVLVAEEEGAWLFAPPYDVQPGDSGFILSCDVMAPKKSSELSYPMVLVRGFQKQDSGAHSSWFHSHFGDGVYYSEQFGSDAQRRDARPGDYLMVYRHTMACRVEQANCWVHVEMGFSLPKQKLYRPERLLFKLYAFMPPGEYRFDNLSLRRATPEEIRAVNGRRPSIRRFTTGKKRQTSEK